jgi:hypothetical protein
MDTADAPGCKNFYSGAMSDPNRGRDSGRAVPTVCNGEWNVAGADLFDIDPFRKEFELIAVETGMKFSVDDRDRCRRSS